LLAEDNANDIELTLAAFEENKLANRVDVVRDGTEAMDYLLCQGKFADRPAEMPVVILLDIKMPKKSGIEVLQEIKQNPDFNKIPVVMLTSSDMEKDICDSYELGVNAYVVKPVDFVEFAKAVKTLGLFWSVLNRTPSK
jgi:CheY-like chemotaxis protein